jgi:hypothetical protein
VTGSPRGHVNGLDEFGVRKHASSGMGQVTPHERPGPLHIAYAVVLVFALTQGPVLSWWIRRPDNPFMAKDVATWATYLIAVLPALCIRRPVGSRNWVLTSPILLYLVFAGWMCVSFLWSSVPQVTGPAALALLFTTIAGVYLATTFRTHLLIWITVWAMVPGLVLSEIANYRHWQYSLDPGNPHWTGIYLNRNSLGPPAVLTILSSATLIIYMLRRPWSRMRPPQILGLLTTMAVAIHLQLRGSSRTSWVFLAVAFAVAALWVLVLLVARTGDRRRVGVVLSSALLTIIACTIIAIYVGHNPLSNRLEFARDFSGRRIYWRYSWSVAREHIFVGQGWLSPWFDPVSRLRLPPELVTETYSHSSFLDVLGGGGLVGLSLGTLAVGVSFLHIARRTMPLVLQGWSLGLCSGVLIASSQEEFLIGYHFFFLLFVAVSCSQPTTNSVWAGRRTYSFIERKLRESRLSRL